MPRVSVIIPTHNRAAWLAEALTGVRAQTFTQYELIIADDGSSDNTAEVVAAWDGPSLHYLPLAHSGRPAVARNRALAQARGELVAFLDDDDRWEPNHLQSHVRALEQDPAAGMAYGDVRFLRDDGALSAPVLAPAQKRGGQIFADLIWDCFIYPSAVVARRSLLQAAGGFDETLPSAEDYGLWLRLAHAAPVAFVPQPPVTIRRHRASFSHRHQQQIARDVIRVLDGLPARLRLTWRQRLQLRRRRARARTHLALLYLAQQADDAALREARRLAAAALRLNPLQPAAWRLLWRSRR